MQISVIGAGSWGTALALLLARNGHDVSLIVRDPDEVAALRATRENLHYLPGFVLPKSVTAYEIGETFELPDYSVIAVPSSSVRAVVSHPALLAQITSRPVLIAAKGLEFGSGKLMTEVVAELHPDWECGVIGGPNLAVEMVRGVPTAAVIAFQAEATAERVRTAFMSSSFRIYISDDVRGIELAGALKNVLAIGAGMSDGLGFGDNTKGALLARGLKEIVALGLKLGCRFETFMGIAGVGDLFATASSVLSRNYRVGFALGKGKSLQEAIKEIGQVAEGVPTSEGAVILARQSGIQMPIFEGIEAVIRGKVAPNRAVGLLMERLTPKEGFPEVQTSSPYPS